MKSIHLNLRDFFQTTNIGNLLTYNIFLFHMDVP